MIRDSGFFSSIRTQMALITSVFSLMVIAALFFLVVTITHNQLKQQKINSIKEEVHAYNLVISRQMSDFNYVAVDDLVQVLTNSPNILAMQVENEFGQEVSRSPETLPKKSSNFFQQPLASQKNDQTVGRISVWWKVPDRLIDANTIFQKVLVYSLLFLFALSVLVYQILAYSVVNPLKQLERRLLNLQPNEKFDQNPYLSKEIVNLQTQYMAMANRIHRQMQYLKQLASQDVLTNLPNRHEIEKAIQSRCERSKITKNKFSVLFLDIDHFKQINDVYGHDTGDQALQEFANVINSCITETTGLLGRFGGDEFVLVIFDDCNTKDIVKMIYKRLNQEFILSEKSLYLSTSIGIACWPYGGESTKELLKSADLALYQSKRNGRNQSNYFTPKMQLEVNKWMHGMDTLKSAMNKNSFLCYGQPIIDTSGNIVWYEILVRLKTENGEILDAGEFLPSAEESGLMKNIAEYTCNYACELLKSGTTDKMLSINLSRSQLLLEDLDDILEPLKPWKSKIIIEVTEEAFLGGQETQSVLSRLQTQGFKIALDDFGSGYSSLAILLELPVDIVKLDKEFQTNIHQRKDAQTMLDAIINMLHILGKQVVAEGIQNKTQYDFAMETGCNYLQGYYLYKPERMTANLNSEVKETNKIISLT